MSGFVLRAIDRLPRLPNWALLTLAVLTATNGLLGLLLDGWRVPGVGLILLLTLLAFGLKAARVDEHEKRNADNA
jgi:hypothetical protein